MKPSDFTTDLPAPRDDEPESLRTNIIDELSDHLHCAIRREELRSASEPRGTASPDDANDNSEPWGLAPRDTANNDSSYGRSPDRATRSASSCGRSPDRATRAAYQRALARFGNPAAIARKLWWDAMWEKIMTQRILTGLTLIAVAACCVMAVFMWQMLTQMQAAQQDMLAESQAQNERLIEQFQALVGEIRVDAENAPPSEWVPLTVKCTLDTDDGPPASGVRIQLQSRSDNTKGIPAIDVTTGDDGVADFGKVLYGEYRLRSRAPNGMEAWSLVSIMPGQPKQASLVCPGGDGLTTVTTQIVPDPSDPPPPELVDQLWYEITLGRQPLEESDEWSRNTNESIAWYLGPNGEFVDGTSDGIVAHKVDDADGNGAVARTSLRPGPLNVFADREVLLPLSIVESSHRAEPGIYWIETLNLCQQIDASGDAIRLIEIEPPPGIPNWRQSHTQRRSGGFGPLSGPGAFRVANEERSVVKVPLLGVPFEYMKRTLAAAPEYVPLKLAVDGRISVASFQPVLPGPRGTLIHNSKAGDVSILSGVEVISADYGREERRWRNFGGSSASRIIATLLVTPDESL